MVRTMILYVVLAAALTVGMTGCKNDDAPTVAEEKPAPAPVYNHWKLEVDPYTYQDYCAAVVTLTKAGEPVVLKEYEVAAFNGNGKCAGVAADNEGASAIICIFGLESDTYTFRLWDCVYAKEREVTAEFEFDTTEAAPQVRLSFRE